jgi:8-oxo-dGTP pyrophosphatase MutT (NUDIX family)
MHRRPLLEMLSRYREAFPDEGPMIDRICALVESHVDCFERTCRPGHVTGAAWILSPDRRRCLLTHHRKLDRWLQLGGHADGQWLVEEVALREAREESGLQDFEFLPIHGSLLPLDVDVHQIPPRYDGAGNLIDDAHEHHDIRFLLVARSEDGVCTSDESHDVAWFTPDEVLERTDEESIHRMLRKTLDLLY